MAQYDMEMGDMSRLDTMARFAEPDPVGPEFECAGCGHGFDLPREGDEMHACDCERQLCADCSECDPCRKLAEREEQLRELAQAAMRADLEFLGII